MKIQDKVVVVTGAGSGIGRGMCRRFHNGGARGVAVVDRDAASAQAVADEIGGIALTADVSKQSDIENAIRSAESEFGPVDLFCSNAGVAFSDGNPDWAASGTDDQWQTAWEVNVLAHLYAARAVLPGMIERGSGYLLNTVSAAGLLNQIGDAAYSTTKHAAIGLAESLSITHGDQGIKVSVLCPQYVRTAMTETFEQSGMFTADGVLTPEEVADSVIAGLETETFLILPHPQVRVYFEKKAADYDRWLGGMRKLRRQFVT